MTALRCLFALGLILLTGTDLFAQTTTGGRLQDNIGPGIGMGLSIVGAGIGLGLIGFSALSGIARQPEQANNLRGVMILMAALVEGVAIISLVLCLLLIIL